MENQRRIETVEVSMIEPEIVRQIRTLASLGWGTRRIAGELKVCRKAVKRYLRGAVVGEQTRPRARRLSAAAAERALTLFEGDAEGNAVVVRDILAAEGHHASERTIQRTVAEARRHRCVADVATVRFETAAGEQMQIDFGEKKVVVAGLQVTVHLMAAVLGYSRRIFVKAFLCERAEDWREGIACAFRHFGGVTRTILVDNTRCLVTGREAETGKPILHPGLVDLCKNFGCDVRACAPYRARTKGKIESGVKYVKRNALAGRQFTSFAELESHLAAWMVTVDQRLHGTTNERPIERFEQEREKLLPLPSGAISVRNRRHRRKVANDAFVDVDTVRYSVPSDLIGKAVEVDIGETTVRIFRGATLVAQHMRSNEPRSLVVAAGHHAGLWASTAKRNAQPATAAAPNEAASTTSPLAAMGRTLDVYQQALGGRS